jgi:hypothetical protein
VAARGSTVRVVSAHAENKKATAVRKIIRFIRREWSESMIDGKKLRGSSFENFGIRSSP